MIIRTLAMPIALAAGLAMPAFAAMPMPSAKSFVMKAGASDTFEIAEAKLMMTSKNDGVRQFASTMVTDHTKSTDMVKAAATEDGLTLAPPMMTAMQKADLRKLRTAKGKARDMLYLKQQKMAHADALALMQGYAASGTAPHLKDAAGQIAPVVQQHIDMLGQMAM